MQMVSVHEDTLESLVTTLASFNGHRSVWIDSNGDVVHTEPDEMLDEAHFRYVATVLQPTRQALADVLYPHWGRAANQRPDTTVASSSRSGSREALAIARA